MRVFSLGKWVMVTPFTKKWPEEEAKLEQAKFGVEHQGEKSSRSGAKKRSLLDLGRDGVETEVSSPGLYVK